jgi:hypothetical protein
MTAEEFIKENQWFAPLEEIDAIEIKDAKKACELARKEERKELLNSLINEIKNYNAVTMYKEYLIDILKSKLNPDEKRT